MTNEEGHHGYGKEKQKDDDSTHTQSCLRQRWVFCTLPVYRVKMKKGMRMV
jgi:hypothetical protein